MAVPYATDLAYIHEAGFSSHAERLAPEIVRLLRRAPPRDTRRPGDRRLPVVELGCGGGRLARHLVAAGFATIGIDRSAAMIAIARRIAPGATFRIGSLASARLPPCRAIVAVGEVLSYMDGLPHAASAPATPPTSAAAARQHARFLRAFFHRAHRALKPGGLLVFDFIESSTGRTYRARSRAGADWLVTSRADVDAATQVLTRRIETCRAVGGRTRRSRETHRVRIYDRDEMRSALAHAGFEVTMRRSLGPIRLLASDVLVVARKAR
jgi:SAM-dependent methyltransferase